MAKGKQLYNRGKYREAMEILNSWSTPNPKPGG